MQEAISKVENSAQVLSCWLKVYLKFDMQIDPLGSTWIHLDPSPIYLNSKCIHRDKTRVQMPAKMFPHMKSLCLLFMGPTLGFDTKQRNSFLIKLGVFYNKKQDSDNIIYS